MNVSIAIEKFDPRVGGAERYCWDMAHYLAGKGHNVTIICRKAKEPVDGAIRVVRLRTLPFPQAMRHLSFALLHAKAIKKLPGYKHFCVGNTFTMDFYQPHGGVHRAWFQKETQLYGKRVRTFVRITKALTPKDMVQRAMEWWIFKVTRPRVIAISEMVAEDMRQFFCYPSSRIHLIPNGIDIQKFSVAHREHRQAIRHRYGLKPEEFVFLFVAQNPRLKGYDTLVSACREITQNSFKVLVIGPNTAVMEEKARSLGCKMVFGGRANDLPMIYPACDCLVHPTYYDACSLVVLESLASGVPVITTRANGASMYIDSSNGSVIEPGDVQGLVQAMKDAMSGRYANVGIGSRLKDQGSVFSDVEELLKSHAS